MTFLVDSLIAHSRSMIKIFLILLFPLQVFSQITVLELGQSRTYQDIKDRVWIEKSSLLKAEAMGSGVRILAKQVGRSQVRINGHIETFEVIHPNQKVLYDQLQKLVSSKPGLHTDVEDGQVVIKGYVHDWKAWKDLSENLGLASYQMKAELSENLKETLQNHLDEDLKSQGLLSVNVIQQPELEVRLNPQQASLDRYQSYFKKMGIPVVLSTESLVMVPVVRVDITVVEMNKQFSRKIGLQPMASAQFQILPHKLVSAENLMATLHLMENQGQAKMLASPNLICRSGKEAEFLAGGEIPIKIANFASQDIIWKKYGVLLKIKPLADSTGRISLSIETEVSSLGAPIDGIPSIQSNRVSSQFDLSHSQVLALSGLLKNDEGHSESGLPFLSQLPILGPLFSSHDYHSHKTELVIFVRPQLLDQQPTSEWTRGASHVSTSL